VGKLVCTAPGQTCFKVYFTDVIFVDRGVKVNGAYYRDVLLTEPLLPMMHSVRWRPAGQCPRAPGTRHDQLRKTWGLLFNSLCTIADVSRVWSDGDRCY